MLSGKSKDIEIEGPGGDIIQLSIYFQPDRQFLKMKIKQAILK